MKMKLIKTNFIKNNPRKIIIVSKKDLLNQMMTNNIFKISKINCLQKVVKITKIARIMRFKITTILIIMKKFKKRNKKPLNQKSILELWFNNRSQNLKNSLFQRSLKSVKTTQWNIIKAPSWMKIKPKSKRNIKKASHLKLPVKNKI